MALSLVSNSAVAASYQQTSGTIVDPIQTISGGGNHAYSGPNLEPGAGLTDAELFEAIPCPART